MDFFERQERSRRTSRLLVVAFAAAFAAVALATTALAAVVLRLYMPLGAAGGSADWLVANARPLALIGFGTLSLMVLASLYRAASLSRGGAQVARLLGGTEITADAGDIARKRLVNVVEEMAIASGLPMPDVYVLEQEAGINAFAAGLTPADAAIAVTRGALEQLDRAELQGVVAHELSHISNGDMRLNQRLIGFSFGILVLSLIGRWLLRSARSGRRRARSSRGTSVALLLGAGFALIGYVGLLFSRLIKAGVSRERERLADASAVQFTREPSGLASALKKIAGFTAQLTAIESEEVSHMLFERGAPAFRGWFATHPPLVERIRALEPHFDPRSLTRAARPVGAPGAAPEAGGAAAGAAWAVGGWPEPAADSDPAPSTALGRPGGDGVLGRLDAVAAPRGPDAVAASPGPDADAPLAHAGSIGSPALGASLRDALPAGVYDAAHSPDASLLLVLALALASDERALNAQRALLEAQLGERRTARVDALRAELAALDPRLRLPILALAVPALKRRPSEQLEYLFDLVTKLVDCDGERSLLDYVLLRMLAAYLAEAPERPLALATSAKLSARAACATLLSVVAAFGHEDEAAARSAFRAGAAVVRGGLPEPRTPFGTLRNCERLDAALATLARAKPRAKKAVLEALLATIRHDRRIGIEELELFRAVAATLGCPLPPWAGLAPHAERSPADARAAVSSVAGHEMTEPAAASR